MTRRNELGSPPLAFSATACPGVTTRPISTGRCKKKTTEKNNTDAVIGQIVVDNDVEEPEEPVIEKSAVGPLWRNILIVIVLLVIAVPTLSYILKGALKRK